MWLKCAVTCWHMGHNCIKYRQMRVADVNTTNYDCELIKQSTEALETNINSKNTFIFHGNVNLRWEVTFQPWEVVHKENTET